MIDDKIAKIANSLSQGLADIANDIYDKETRDEGFYWSEYDEKFFDYLNKELLKLEIKK